MTARPTFKATARWSSPIPPLVLISQREMVERIEFVRATTDEGGRTVPTRLMRRCYGCKADKWIPEDFYRDRAKPYGYSYMCKPCRKAENEETHRRAKIRRFRASLEVAS